MLKNIALITLVGLVSTTACVKTSGETNVADGSVVESKTDDRNAATPENFKETTQKAVAADGKVFRGKINGIAFEMRLVRDGDKLSGTYFYTKVRKNLNLAGTIDRAGKFKLQETDQAGKKTGAWEGTWKEEAHDNGITLEGDWRKPNGGDTFGFYATEQIVEFGGGVRFTDKTIKETDKARRSEISAVYPEIAGIETATATKFNAAVKNIVADANAAYKNNIAELTAEEIQRMPSVGLSNEINYEVALANDGFVSLIISEYSYLGGAHGGMHHITLNYDLKNNREVNLANIFEPDADYLKTISEYSIADLKRRVGDLSDDDWIERGAAADANNYQNWNLTKKGLMFIFEQYQVAAYAAGPQTVIVPYEKLKNILRKDALPKGLVK